nr:polymeric immunoglobulin receptor [Nothobranchius furzeri]
MMFPVVLHLMLAGLLGVHCNIITVTEVSVQTGSSISIPCLYTERYRNSIKYLCKGKQWISCIKVAETTQNRWQRFSISDDTQLNIFTVTINNLTSEDKHFWCAVDRFIQDIKQHFTLSVTSGTPSLYVNHQEITTFERGSVTITCRYTDQNVTGWCRLGGSCVRDDSGSLDGTTVKITRVSDVYEVTMTNLTTENSGWYWCASTDLQIPVHIIVHNLRSTVTVPTLSSFPADITGAFEDVTSGKSSVKMILITILIVLLFIFLAALLGWRMIKQRNNKLDVRDIHMSSQTVVFYATVDHNQRPQAQIKDQTLTEDVTYTTIQINLKQTTSPEGAVIYNTLQ